MHHAPVFSAPSPIIHSIVRPAVGRGVPKCACDFKRILSTHTTGQPVAHFEFRGFLVCYEINIIRVGLVGTPKTHPLGFHIDAGLVYIPYLPFPIGAINNLTLVNITRLARLKGNHA